MILSFGYTWPAFVAKAKTCTRRAWSMSTVASYTKGLGPELYPGPFSGGKVHEAWDKVPHAKGRRIGTLRLTHVPFCRPLEEMSDQDFVGEGFDWFACQSFDTLKGAMPSMAKQLWCPTPTDYYTASLACGKDAIPAEVSRQSWRLAFERWRCSGQSLYVVRFEILTVEEDAVERLRRLTDES